MEAIDRKTYTVDEVAVILGIGRTLAYSLVRSGKLPGIKCGGRWIIPIVGLNKWLDDPKECV